LFEPALARLDCFKSSSVAGFQLDVTNTVNVFPVWARDLYFGAWNILDLHKQVSSFIPDNYLFK
jgi:hypothetical protein